MLVAAGKRADGQVEITLRQVDPPRFLLHGASFTTPTDQADPTQPLPANWPLRRRMEALCRRAELKYRDILLWRTNSSMGNAMVMGLFPRVRYIFLSDLLLMWVDPRIRFGRE